MRGEQFRILKLAPPPPLWEAEQQEAECREVMARAMTKKTLGGGDGEGVRAVDPLENLGPPLPHWCFGRLLPSDYPPAPTPHPLVISSVPTIVACRPGMPPPPRKRKNGPGGLIDAFPVEQVGGGRLSPINSMATLPE